MMDASKADLKTQEKAKEIARRAGIV